MRGLGTVRGVPTLEWGVLGQCEVSQRLSEGPGTVRGVPTLEQVVLGQCEVSQHLNERSWDSTNCPNTRSWDSAKCPNTRTRGPGTIRSVPTFGLRVLGQWEVSHRLILEVLGQCEVSQRLSEGSWDSTRCTNT